MSTQESTAVHISSSEDIDSLIERLPQIKDGRVLITVAEKSDALLTAAEFYRVLGKARESNVRLSISTKDRLRQELARMLGWVVVDTDAGSGSRGNTDELPSLGTTDDLKGAWTQVHTTSDLATYRPSAPFARSSPGNSSGKHGTGTIVVGPEQRERVAGRESGHDTQSTMSNGSQSDSNDRDVEADEREPRRRFPRPTRRALLLIGAIGAPLVVLAVVAGLLMYILPTATVTIVPVEKSISADLVYGLATAGNKYDLTIQPVAITHTSTFDKTIPTTGERFEPDGTAGGNVLLTNPLLQPVTVPSGSKLAGKNGLNYITQADITVPAADPYGTLSFGSATVAVAASEAGDSGNTGAGTIVGQLNSGIFFNNRDAISGGTMKRIAVVSQADLDALKQAAEGDLSGRVDKEFQSSVASGMQLVPGSVTKTDPSFEYSADAGKDGTEVSIHATQTVTGEVFDPGKLNALAKDEAARQLAAKAGPNEIILGDTVTIGDPVALPGGISFSRHATARTRAVISADEQQALESQVVGKSKPEVQSIIQTMSDVASYQILIKPSWLPQRMPELNSHIKIVVSNTDGITASP